MPFPRHYLSRYLIALACLPFGVVHADLYHEWVPRHFNLNQATAGMASPQADPDGDGCANVVEYLAGTDPWSSASFLRIHPGSAAGTISFTINPRREDVVYVVAVSSDLQSWSEDARLLSAGSTTNWDLNNFKYVKVGVKRRIGFVLDSDQDGLDDFFEEKLVSENAADQFRYLGDIRPDDDFDQDGTSNLDEKGNAPEAMPGGSFSAPRVIDPATLNRVLATNPDSPPRTLVVHTPLR